MRMKTPLLAGVLSFAYATPAFACNFWFDATHLAIPSRPTWGVGAAMSLDPTVTGISGDLSLKLGDKAVVRPGIGFCTGDGSSDPYFGAGVGFQLAQNANMTLNIQSGISYLSFDGGSQMVIPINLAARFNSASAVSFYAGGGIWWGSIEIDGLDESVSDSDPAVFGGLQGRAGTLGWTAGGALKFGDDTDFLLVGGLSFSPGASAIRRIGSLFRK